jgi:cystathionine beta-lyase/cystathionine gamma-synthase
MVAGYFDTLMSASAASTSSEMAAGELAASGITPGYVRMSVGLTGESGGRVMRLILNAILRVCRTL